MSTSPSSPLVSGSDGPARRFLHMCYCCASTDAAADFYGGALRLREVMRNPIHPSDGSLLGIDGEIVSGAAFLYDRRGARTSPSVEVQEWVRPGLVGTPRQDPRAVGMQAVGFAVPDASDVVVAAERAGARVAAAGRNPWGATWTTMADPAGVLFDVVDDVAVPVGESRFRHLRITVSDLARSTEWYHGLGFATISDHEVADASFLGDEGSARVRRLRLPDEATEVVLVEWNDGAAHGRHPDLANHIGWFRTAVCVDDTRRSYDEFRAAGWVFEREPREVELEGTTVPDMWICFLNDPDGVPFEFVQRPRSAFRPERS